MPSYALTLAMLQEIMGCTVNVPGQEAIKLVALPQFAVTPILLYVPSFGLFQSITTGDPSQLMPVAVSPLPQVKAGGVIGRVAYPWAGTVPQARGSALGELEGVEEELLISSELELEAAAEPLTSSELELEAVAEPLASSELELETAAELLLRAIPSEPLLRVISSKPLCEEQEDMNIATSTMLAANRKSIVLLIITPLKVMQLNHPLIASLYPLKILT